MSHRYLLQPLRYGAASHAAQAALHNGLAVTDDPDVHLRDKILAVLFTAPGERVNRPNFGVGLDRVLFEPLDELKLGTIEFRVTQGLTREIGDEILLDAVDLTPRPVGGELHLLIRYRRREDRIPRQMEIEL